ncbi:MAG: rod shape-determining protein RodA [Gemmatimonadaceae bacterium]|nr:rod shape-determining protein RodA [Gemmatimonadaceae bacterium]
MNRRVADAPLFAIALALSLFGIAMVYSAGQTDTVTIVVNLWKGQLAWFVVAVIAAFFIQRSSVRFLDWATPLAYVGTILLLGITLVVGSGAGTAASTKSWLRIGGVNIGQPAEIAKITVVLMLARVLANRREPPESLLDLWHPALIVGIPWVLIMLQPDLGTGIVFVGIFFAMLFWSGVNWRLLLLTASPAISLLLAFNTQVWGAWFIVLLLLVWYYRPYLLEGVGLVTLNVITGVVAPVLWETLKPYQQKRLLVFLDPTIDAKASGYHVIQSQVAIGSGGWFGKGFTLGTQKRLAFLPEQQTDFIFAVVGEELGFLGVAVALSLFLLLFIRVVRVASRANDAFASLIAFGLLASWLVHVIENVGMTLNLMPITGIPLPFFSYGKSFMLASWLAVGILLLIAREGRGRGDLLGR